MPDLVRHHSLGITEQGEGISTQLQNSDITVNAHGRKLPVSGRRIQRFLQFGLGSHQLPMFSAVLLGASMLPEPVGSAHIVVVWLLQMSCT